jgi:hypothetical protein
MYVSLVAIGTDGKIFPAIFGLYVGSGTYVVTDGRLAPTHVARSSCAAATEAPGRTYSPYIFTRYFKLWSSFSEFR